MGSKGWELKYIIIFFRLIEYDTMFNLGLKWAILYKNYELYQIDIKNRHWRDLRP